MGYRLTDIDRLTAEIRERNTLLGWRQKGNTFGDYIALLASEVSEMVEAYRDHKLADATKDPEPVYQDREIPKIRRDDVYRSERVIVKYRPAKPEGVGSEVADVAIRLLDMTDVFGYAMKPSYPKDFVVVDAAPRTFGDWCALLHMSITDAYVQHYFMKSPEGTARCLAVVLERLSTLCVQFDLDLEAEVARKMTYNATRPYRHGRGTLVACTCESEDWTSVTDADRGEDGLNHHPRCPQGKVRTGSELG